MSKIDVSLGIGLVNPQMHVISIVSSSVPVVPPEPPIPPEPPVDAPYEYVPAKHGNGQSSGKSVSFGVYVASGVNTTVNGKYKVPNTGTYNISAIVQSYKTGNIVAKNKITNANSKVITSNPIVGYSTLTMISGIQDVLPVTVVQSKNNIINYGLEFTNATAIAVTIVGWKIEEA